MRLALACLTSPKGDVDGNLARHLDVLAASAGCDVVVFPEMSLTGYLTPAAGWDRAITVDDPAVAALVAATRGGPAAAFGIVEAAGAGNRRIAQVLAVDGALGIDGEPLHAWAIDSDDPVDAEVLEEGTAGTGAVVMGRRLFDTIDGRDGWSDEMGQGAHHAITPPFFVVTHEAPASVRLSTATHLTYALRS